MKIARTRAPASSANLGPGFDVLALALDLFVEVDARPSTATRIEWRGEGEQDVPLDASNLIVRAAQEGWDRLLPGIEVRVRNAIPIGKGFGSSAAAIVAGIEVGARLRGIRVARDEVIRLGLPLEGHADNLAAATYGGLCVAVVDEYGVRVHRLEWPPRWKAVLFVPDNLSPTHEARRLVPLQPLRADAVFNMARVAEWILAVTRRDRILVASAMEDRLHQPGRTQAYAYLAAMIDAAHEAGALGAALSGAGGSVIAIADRNFAAIGRAMVQVAERQHVAGRILRVDALARR